MRVTHIITSLDVGGTEMMLRRLVTRLQVAGVDNSVVCLGRAGGDSQHLQQMGIALHELNMKPRVPSLRAVVRLRRVLAALRPDVVHTWMYHADLMGSLAAGLTRLAPVMWGIHHTPQESDRLRLVTRAIVRTNAVLSKVVPARIVCCAHAAKEAHLAMGYAGGKMQVIPNGFDTNVFHPDPSARVAVREELGVAADTPLIAQIARFHPQKDHRTFVHAAERLMHTSSPAHFVLAGRGVDRGNATLVEWVDATGAPERWHCLGVRHDVSRLMAACDIVTTASCSGEGLPLVLGEAMSCGVPCVTTDVGDSARLVGDTGRVIPAGDPRALAAAWTSLLDLPPEARLGLGERARARVVAEYHITDCVAEYLAAYRELSRSVPETPSG
jgi:glycosyltransferase involved in cell wall biosynthesis